MAAQKHGEQISEQPRSFIIPSFELYTPCSFLSNQKLLQFIIDTEAKQCFATHDEDIDYFNMRIYIILIACVYIQQFNFVQ